MTNVYVLHHVHVMEGGVEDVKFIGVYSSHECAHAAMARAGALPGFVDAPDGFSIDKYRVDQDQWVEGYATLAGK